MFHTIVPRRRLLILFGALLPLFAIASLVPNSILIVFVSIGFIISAADAFFSVRGIPEIRIQLPDIVRLSKGRPGTIPVLIQHSGIKTNQLRIGLPFPESFQADLELEMKLPTDSIHSHAEWPCRPLRRGRYEVAGMYQEFSSGLGFWSIRKKIPVQTEIRVYPNLLEDRKKMAALFINKADYGAHARKMLGLGREFEKLREYISGDGYDQIHWKATAKRGRPITKVFQWERTQEVYVVLDCSRLSARESDSETALEFYLKAALILGSIAQRQGDLFGVITFSDRVQGFVRAGNGKEHYAACRDTLYSLEPRIVTPDFEDLFTLIRLRLRRRALLIFLTDLSDSILSESFVRSAALVARLHLMLVNQIRASNAQPLFRGSEASSVDSLYEKLSGHLQWQNLQEVKNALHRYGIQFTTPGHANLTGEIVSQYLTVKQRQQL